jgi:RecA/RadA recombinase
MAMPPKRGVRPVDPETAVEVRIPEIPVKGGPPVQHMHLNVRKVRAGVEKLLEYVTFEPSNRMWLTTDPLLSGVLGSRDKGIPYGKILEVFGEEHGGKTLIVTYLAGLAQQDNAGVGRCDIEDSQDDAWDRKFGLDPEQVFTVRPKLIVKKSGKVRLQSAEELFAETEEGFHQVAKQGFKKQFWFVDSVAMLRTQMAIEAGVAQNMRTRNDRSIFLSEKLPEWAGIAANYNATIVLVNQLRNKPGMVWGDPTDSPGGRALRHAASIRARVRRKGPPILSTKTGRVIGLTAWIQNIKNKSGGGSTQGDVVGMKIRWSGSSATLVFMPKAELDSSIKKSREKKDE